MTTPLPIYVRVSQAPEVFGVSTSTIYRLAQRGEITIHKRGGASFLRVSEMVDFIEGANGSINRTDRQRG